MRYVERNPVRAKLARHAEHWHWSSARYWTEDTERPGYLVSGPVKRPRNWLEWVKQALTVPKLAALGRSVNRGYPFWQRRLGAEDAGATGRAVEPASAWPSAPGGRNRG